jgi:hypothetical protein
MKQFLVSILAIFYLGTSVGATVNLHYCMGRLVNWDLAHKHQQKKTCGKCGMQKQQSKKNGCCEDKYKVLQGEKDQKGERFYQFSQPLAETMVTSFPSLTQSLVSVIAEAYPVCNAPPPNGVSISVLNCVFRI